MAPPTPKSSAEGNHSLRVPSTSDGTEREKLSPVSPESLGRAQMPPSCPGPWGKTYLGGVGAGCCSKVHPYPPLRCPRSRGTENPGPTPSPSAPGQGIGPAARACGLGPSPLARVTVRGRGEERTVSDAPSPSPTPPAPSAHQHHRRPPHRGHPSGAPEPLGLNLVPHSSEAARKPAPPLEPPEERQRRPRGRQSGAGVGRGEAGLDRAGCDEGGGRRVRVAAARARGRRLAGKRSGTQGHLGVGGTSLRLGRGQSPDRAALRRLSGGTTRVLPRSSGTRGRGGSGAPGGCRQEPGGRRAPPGQGVGPRVPGGK